MTIAPIIALAPHVIQLLELALEGVKISQRPEVSDEEIEAYAARCRMAGTNLDVEIKKAVEERRAAS